MSKPRKPINTPAKVTAAREYLGLDKAGLARALRLGQNGRGTVRRMEEGGNIAIYGPVQIALEAMIDAKGKPE